MEQAEKTAQMQAEAEGAGIEKKADGQMEERPLSRQEKIAEAIQERTALHSKAENFRKVMNLEGGQLDTARAELGVTGDEKPSSYAEYQETMQRIDELNKDIQELENTELGSQEAEKILSQATPKEKKELIELNLVGTLSQEMALGQLGEKGAGEGAKPVEACVQKLEDFFKSSSSVELGAVAPVLEELKKELEGIYGLGPDEHAQLSQKDRELLQKIDDTIMEKLSPFFAKVAEEDLSKADWLVHVNQSKGDSRVGVATQLESMQSREKIIEAERQDIRQAFLNE
ncbi:hypothetical protein ACFL2B_00280 [Patescibacteria group bacterium]